MSSNGLRVLALGIAGWLVAGGAGAAQASIELRRFEMKIQETLVQKLGDDAKPIRVALNGRKAFLTGTVESRVTRELAKEVVLSFDEVSSATNRIDVRKPVTIAEGQAFLEGQDAELEFRVNRAVAAAIGDLAKAIEIEVCEGVASLRGRVPDESTRELALKTAQDVAGIRQLLDLLKPVQ